MLISLLLLFFLASAGIADTLYCSKVSSGIWNKKLRIGILINSVRWKQSNIISPDFLNSLRHFSTVWMLELCNFVLVQSCYVSLSYDWRNSLCPYWWSSAQSQIVFWMSKPFTVSRWSNFCMLCCLHCSHSSVI